MDVCVLNEIPCCRQEILWGLAFGPVAHDDDLAVCCLAGTSGDTGGSAICSARGLDGVDVLVVFPLGRITTVQERHMTTSLGDNVHVFAGGS